MACELNYHHLLLNCCIAHWQATGGQLGPDDSASTLARFQRAARAVRRHGDCAALVPALAPARSRVVLLGRATGWPLRLPGRRARSRARRELRRHLRVRRSRAKHGAASCRPGPSSRCARSADTDACATIRAQVSTSGNGASAHHHLWVILCAPHAHPHRSRGLRRRHATPPREIWAQDAHRRRICANCDAALVTFSSLTVSLGLRRSTRLRRCALSPPAAHASCASGGF